ncbi:agamous-like MADS-box protein AGL29 [Solanum stenotomum]|uniref:agamous-like MADS-box protein AGL29 n=1 Tax=Solanum stenotomum TaxID=172797 RepID=UPI0020D0E107|nr:agamous-like MADS-box protein AGL29 [Solanum stenotomum]
MEGKKTLGRRKIPLEKIEKEAARYSSFSKRRSGLYKKASELVREFDVNLGIVLSSPSGKSYSFVHPTTDVAIDRFINPTTELDLGAQLVAAEARNKVIQNSDRLNELDAREKAAKEKIRFMDQKNEARVRCWWESMDQFNAEDITKFEGIMNTAEGFLNVQLKQLEDGASSSIHSPPKDADS